MKENNVPDASASNRFVVIARDGVKLRTGPSTDFPAVRTLPSGTPVTVLSREGIWGLVDLEGDGQADGFVSTPFLRPADAGSAPALGLSDITAQVTPAIVKSIFRPERSLPTLPPTFPSCWQVFARANSATA
jgi:hypothetical protein